MYVRRADPFRHGKYASVCAVIAPGAPPNPRVVDINDFHCSYAHTHEDLLRQTAKKLGVELRGELRPCRGCLEGKGLRRPTRRSTHSRAVKPASRGFEDLMGPKPIRSRGGKWYMMIVRNDYSRYARVYFLRSKDEAVRYFRKFIAEIHHRNIETVSYTHLTLPTTPYV